MLEKIRTEATDPSLLLGAYPTFFYHLGATAEGIAFLLEVDSREEPDGYQEWYSTLKKNFTRKAKKAAAVKVDKKSFAWKADQIDRLAAMHKKKLEAKAQSKNESYFIELAKHLGLQVTCKGAPVTAYTKAPQTAGQKCSALGSTPNPKPMELDPSTPKATKVNLPHAISRQPPPHQHQHRDKIPHLNPNLQSE